MKLFLVSVLVAVATAARLENTYLPPSSAQTAGGSSSFLNAPRPSASTSEYLLIFSSFLSSYETENRISHEESGQLKNPGTDNEISSVQGQFSYTGDDGATYSITYTADENGFRPEGAHLPVAPPIPAEILKALEQNAADEAAGIVDDGQYRAEHQGEGAGGAGGFSGATGGAGGFSGATGGAGKFSGATGGAGGFSGAVSNQYLGPKPSSSSGSGGYRY
ncbi:pupal cuticle protein 36-like [Tribolium madens]|uniref:pupal cuticle protein 36-like n=1 Tax=Tribolium madens TaxID=41895 RepID=UPI001CF74831|nr:pupal cuticle protein 36-like [Tribolium madens]